VKYLVVFIGLFLIGCGTSGEYVYQIRTHDRVAKKYVLYYVIDSSLIVQDYYPVKRGAYHVLPLRTVDSIWHRWSSVTTKVRTGVLIGAVSGFLFGGINSRINNHSGFDAPFVGLSAAGIGAIIASNIPSDDLLLLPEDTQTLPFLQKHSKLRSLEDFPVGVLDSLLSK
jgi:hypothetical protein